MLKAHRGLAFLILWTYLVGFVPPLFAANPLAAQGLALGQPPAGPTQSAPSSGKPDAPSAPVLPVLPNLPAEAAPGGPAARAQLSEQALSPIERSFSTPVSPAGQVASELALPRSLKQFGYNLFYSPATTFAPVLDVPVGPDYVLGPGDTLVVNVWGFLEQSLQVTLDREGKIFLPKVGPVSLWGLSLQEAKLLIEQQLSRSFSKFQVSISMGALRTIKVFVLGEAVQPGAYELSALSTLSNALFVAGGPSKIGTMRHIQHFRNNKNIGELDLYDLIIRGDKTKDARVESGDVVLIPPIGPVVGITGNVKRPGIYELSGPESLNVLIQMAGGTTPLAYLERVQVERVKNHQERVLLDFDLIHPPPASDLSQATLQDGDLVKILAIHGRLMDAVYLEGVVRHPGEYAFAEGMRISQLVTDQELLPESYLDRAELVRIKPDLTTEVLSFSIRKIQQGQTDQDLQLSPGDRVVVSSEFRKSGTVTLSGEVLRPGNYTLSPGERLSSVLRRAGGYTKNAYLPAALFFRKSVMEKEDKELSVFAKSQEERLISESVALSAGGVAAADAAAELGQRRELLKVIASKVTLGRIVVHLDQPDRMEGTQNDIILEDGDTLGVPPPPSAVVVLGSVRNSTGILYQEGATVEYYLNRAGGPTEDANSKGIYVIKADGSALTDLSLRAHLDRGDTVVVPVSTEAKYRPLPLWRDVATIIGQFAITIAAMKVVF